MKALWLHVAEQRLTEGHEHALWFEKLDLRCYLRCMDPMEDDMKLEAASITPS